MSKEKDYHKILGVRKNASKEEIKNAYKKLAKQYHPDLNKNPGSAEKFKEINEAAVILGDDQKVQHNQEKKKSDFIDSVEGYAIATIITLSIVYLLTYFGIVFRRGIILYMILFTIGPWLLILSVISYVTAKVIGWQQEEKHEKSVIMIIFVIGILIYLSTTGLMSKGIEFAKSLTYTPSELFGDEPSHDNPLFSNMEKCSDDSVKCNGVCYSKCESGEGIYLNGQYLSYKDQNYCNGNYWPDCGPSRKFVCDPIKGGICDYDPLKCEETGKHSCKGTCWEGCPSGSQFICDDVRGGTCKSY